MIGTEQDMHELPTERGQLATGTRRIDSIVRGVGPLDTLPGRMIGAKPAAMCRGSLPGTEPGDSLDDLFRGPVPRSTRSDDARYATALAFFYGRHVLTECEQRSCSHVVARSFNFREPGRPDFWLAR